MRVWRFSLYYVVVFGAYVALAAWLPKLLRGRVRPEPVPRGLADRPVHLPGVAAASGGRLDLRPRRSTCHVRDVRRDARASGILMMPYGCIVIERNDGTTNEILPWTVGVGMFTLLVFITGCAMGIGRRPSTSTSRVLPEGRRRGRRPRRIHRRARRFFLPPMFAYATAWTGAPQATFGVLFLRPSGRPCGCTGRSPAVLHRQAPTSPTSSKHDYSPQMPG